jgi:hypothetical protein
MTIYDGTSPTPLSLAVPLGVGNVSWTEQYDLRPVMSRGSLHSIKQGPDMPMEVELEAHFQQYTGETSGDPSIYDALTGTGRASALSWATTDTASDRFATTVKLVITPKSGSGDLTETLTFAKCALKTIAFSEGEDTNKVKFSLVCNSVKPTSVRS